MKVSICIPVYSIPRIEHYLTRCLDSVLEQTFEDFEVVISDNSEDEEIEKIVRTYGMRINYFKNSRKGISANTNEAMKYAKGELIKILYQDDWFSTKESLKEMVENFKGEWMITASDNNLRPRYTEDIFLGNNKLGSPSALLIKNKGHLTFDETLTWVLDCDFYKRMYDLYGEPQIMRKAHVNIGIHDRQMTNILSDELKLKEVQILAKRYTVVR